MLAKELEGEGGVGDYGAALLLDCLADHSGALDVAGLSFADSEDVSDALDAIDEAGLCLIAILAASEGFLDCLVDYLRELRHGEVDDACVRIHVVLSFVCLAPREGLEPSRPSVVACLLSLAEGWLLQPPGVMKGGGCLIASPVDYESYHVLRIAAELIV